MPKDPRHIGFILFDGFSNLVLANAVEPLRAANGISGRAIYRWSLVGLDSGAIQSCSDIDIVPRVSLEAAAPFDMLFVVSGYGMRGHVNRPNIASLQRARHLARVLGGIDTGSWLLAAAGLLDGLRATIHWQELDAFAEEFPQVAVCDERHVTDGNRVTAGGATDAMDLMLQMVRDDGDGALALQIMRLFSFDISPQNLIRRRIGPLPFSARSLRVTRAMEAMMANLEEPKSLEDIAAAAGSSLRTLNRKFIQELQMPPGKAYQQLRLQFARALVEETNLGLTDIAARSGFASAASLSRAFRTHFEVGTRELRAQALQKGSALEA